MMKEPRLGHINFINCLPLSYGLSHGGFGDGLEVHPAVPARLNRAVLAGELDASPVSSIIYAQHADKFLLLPDVTISAAGALESIMLVSKVPITELDQKKIALTAKSATSHVLLKIILGQAYQVAPFYFISYQSLAEGVLDTADAVLFIGDDALHAYLHQDEQYYYYDLGAEWKKLTGGQMVYAVWVVNRSAAAANPALAPLLHKRVTGGFAFGLENLAEAAAERAQTANFTAQEITHYIRLLNYAFTPQHQQALLEFYRRAHQMGLIEAVPTLAFAEV